MHSTTLFSILAAASLASAATLPGNVTAKRNTKDDPLLVTFWEKGCQTDGGQETIVISDDGPTKPGDCVAIDNYGWTSVQIDEDTATTYNIDIFSGLGCNNFVLVSFPRRQ